MKSGLPLAFLSVAALAAAGAVRRRGSFSTLPDASLDALRDGEAFDPERPYTVTSGRGATVTFDPDNGIGAVSDNTNINYMGFVAWMPVSKWLALNPGIHSQGDSVKALETKLREGAAFGPPFLEVEIADRNGLPISLGDVKGGLAPLFGRLRVRSHEGRHRMEAIQRFAGDMCVPVQVFFGSGFRARDFTPAMLRGTRIQPDPRARSASSVPIQSFVLTKTVDR